MRLQHSPEDDKYSEWLLDVGHGCSIQLTPPPIDYFLDHAILVPQNIDVDELAHALTLYTSFFAFFSLLY